MAVRVYWIGSSEKKMPAACWPNAACANIEVDYLAKESITEHLHLQCNATQTKLSENVLGDLNVEPYWGDER